MQSEQKKNNEVRREMLAAIRRNLTASKPFDAVYKEQHALHENGEQTTAVLEEETATPLERFKQSLESVVGNCIVVKNEAEAAEELNRIIEKRDAERIAVSDSLLVGRVTQLVNGEKVFLKKVAKPNLFDCDLGITGAQFAIAETGTLVLESDKEWHRLTSLVPTVHVAIIEAGKIRRTLGDVLQELNDAGNENLSRTVTFITGPSRTSDIELTLAIGVHGPAELYVIVIDGETNE